jgi:hypothetical protein
MPAVQQLDQAFRARPGKKLNVLNEKQLSLARFLPERLGTFSALARIDGNEPNVRELPSQLAEKPTLPGARRAVKEIKVGSSGAFAASQCGGQALHGQQRRPILR